MEVDGVKGDELGGSEESVEIDFPHRAGDTVGAGGGTDDPTVVSQGVVDVLAFADGACFIKVWVFWITRL